VRQNETLSRSSDDKIIDLEQLATEIEPSGAGHATLPMEAVSSKQYGAAIAESQCSHLSS
jgi:hypothetical protein